jgi:uncharacterized protein (DUF924 family)
MKEDPMITPEAVLSTWLDEVGPDRWYAEDAATDAMLRDRFGDALAAARKGAYDHWILSGRSALALLILLDQFGRNIHRGKAEAFAGDAHAIALAKRALNLNLDLWVDEPERQFFYLPLMHSESQCDQDRCVRLMLTRMPETNAHNLPHAIAHRNIIRRFGRFPFRNSALGRCCTSAEQAWLDQGGYRAEIAA